MSILWQFVSFDDANAVVTWAVLGVIIALILIIFFLLMFLPWDKIQTKHEERLLRRKQIKQQEREAELKRQQEAKAKRLAEEERRKRELEYLQSNIAGVDLHRKRKHVNYQETGSYSCSSFGVMNGGLGFSNSTISPNYRKYVTYEDEFKSVNLGNVYREEIPGKFDASNNQAYRTLRVIGFELLFNFDVYSWDNLRSVCVKCRAPASDLLVLRPFKPFIASEWDDIVFIMKDGTRRAVKGMEFREIKHE